MIPCHCIPASVPSPHAPRAQLLSAMVPTAPVRGRACPGGRCWIGPAGSTASRAQSRLEAPWVELFQLQLGQPVPAQPGWVLPVAPPQVPLGQGPVLWVFELMLQPLVVAGAGWAQSHLLSLEQLAQPGHLTQVPDRKGVLVAQVLGCCQCAGNTVCVMLLLLSTLDMNCVCTCLGHKNILDHMNQNWNKFWETSSPMSTAFDITISVPVPWYWISFRMITFQKKKVTRLQQTKLSNNIKQP